MKSYSYFIGKTIKERPVPDSFHKYPICINKTFWGGFLIAEESSGVMAAV
jgi:hypothetical protein